jgi:hypothetical protein
VPPLASPLNLPDSPHHGSGAAVLQISPAMIPVAVQQCQFARVGQGKRACNVNMYVMVRTCSRRLLIVFKN